MARAASLARISISDLEELLESRRLELRRLDRQRTKWQKKVDQLTRRIVSLGGENGQRGRSAQRARNDASLPQAIGQVLSKARGPMNVGVIAEKVRASGYQSNSANFRQLVNMTLVKDERFVSTERGMYILKKPSAA
jgi:hypothetical protein